MPRHAASPWPEAAGLKLRDIFPEPAFLEEGYGELDMSVGCLQRIIRGCRRRITLNVSGTILWVLDPDGTKIKR